MVAFVSSSPKTEMYHTKKFALLRGSHPHAAEGEALLNGFIAGMVSQLFYQGDHVLGVLERLEPSWDRRSASKTSQLNSVVRHATQIVYSP